MPAMMGYMLGRAMSPPVPLYYGPPTAFGSPQERQQQSLYSGGGYVGSVSSGSTRSTFNATAPASSSGPARVATSSSTTSRGGFGATGRSYSGGSGS